MKNSWLVLLLLVPILANASVIVCESPGHPVSPESNFNPQNVISNYATELNSQVWRCNNGVSATIPALLKSYRLLQIEPSVIYNLSTQPPYTQGSYGLAMFDSKKNPT